MPHPIRGSVLTWTGQKYSGCHNRHFLIILQHQIHTYALFTLNYLYLICLINLLDLYIYNFSWRCDQYFYAKLLTDQQLYPIFQWQKSVQKFLDPDPYTDDFQNFVAIDIVQIYISCKSFTKIQWAVFTWSYSQTNEQTNALVKQNPPWRRRKWLQYVCNKKICGRMAATIYDSSCDEK